MVSRKHIPMASLCSNMPDKYVVYCSGSCGDKRDREKGQGGVGIAVREKITRDVALPTEFVHERLLKLTLELRDRASAVEFLSCMNQPNLLVTRDKNMPSRQHWTRRQRRYPITNSCLYSWVPIYRRVIEGKGGQGVVSTVECSVPTAGTREMITIRSVC